MICRAQRHRFFDQRFITDGIAVAADHGGNLSVKKRFGNKAGQHVKNFDVLAPGMENFGDAGVFQQFDKGGKVQSLGQRIDNGSVIRSSDLNQAEFA